MPARQPARSLRGLPAAGALLLAGWSGGALARDLTITPTNATVEPVRIELIESSRLGCGEGMPLWSTASGGGQCPFDSATRGARISATPDWDKGSIEAYATVARSVNGAFTPERLLTAPENRSEETVDLFLVGFKGSAFDNRLKMTAEFARTQSTVDRRLAQDLELADWTRQSGTSSSLRLDATLIDRPSLKWSLSGEYRAVSDDYSVGQSADLLSYFAMPGTRLALTTKGRVGELALSAGVEDIRSPFGESVAGKAGLDFQGLSLTLRSRRTSASPIAGSDLLDSRTMTNAAYLDVDTEALAAWLLPSVDALPFLVPTNLSLSYQSGETENRFDGRSDLYGRSSLGIDASWDTAIGESSISYWRDRRTGLSDGTRSRWTETVQADHFIRWGHWRFGIDASLSRSRGDGATGYDDRSMSFGQSIAYSKPDGPEFRLQMGQDRGRMRVNDWSYSSSDDGSWITASLDLSKYLQKRFERGDLHLTFDYRKALERSDGEWTLFDEMVERWDDSYRREGLLMSFAMKL